MSFDKETLVDWADFEAAQKKLGANFARILRYFEEDGVKSVATIELAMRQRNAVDLVTPAQTLKVEASQFGAEALSDLAEEIEMAARHFVEARQTPEELVADVVNLRPIFEETLAQLQDAINPLVERESAPEEKRAVNTKFGRF